MTESQNLSRGVLSRASASTIPDRLAVYFS